MHYFLESVILCYAFKRNLLSSVFQNVYTAEIFENSPFNTTVTTVFARDADRPDSNGFNLIRYYMEDPRFDVHPITVSA